MLSNGLCPKIGEVYFIMFEGRGSVQRGWRPGLIIQNNMGNRFSPNVIAIPLTSAKKRMGQPTHVMLHAHETGLKLDSVALCENPETISKEMIGNYVTTIPANYMTKIAVSMMFSMPVISYLDKNMLIDIWNRTFVYSTY